MAMIDSWYQSCCNPLSNKEEGETGDGSDVLSGMGLLDGDGHYYERYQTKSCGMDLETAYLTFLYGFGHIPTGGTCVVGLWDGSHSVDVLYFIFTMEGKGKHMSALWTANVI